MLGNIFSFRGRIGQLGYFLTSLAWMATLIGFGVMLAGMNPKGAGGVPLLIGQVVFALIVFAFTWIWLAVTVRRLRDMGWNVIIGLAVVLVLPFGAALLMAIPGNGGEDFDAGVFSDDEPKKAKPRRAAGPKNGEPGGFAWMRPKPQAFTPAPYVPPQPTYAPNGARATFGLRR